jgi:hypothetical protein
MLFKTALTRSSACFVKESDSDPDHIAPEIRYITATLPLLALGVAALATSRRRNVN